MVFESFWHFITFFGGIEVWTVIFLGVITFYFLTPEVKRNKIGWMVFVLLPSVLISVVINDVIKTTLQIPRPCDGSVDCPEGYSFPSMHSTIGFVLASSVWLNVRRLDMRLGFLLLAALIALSRVVLNYHTYLDIFAGALVGIFVTWAMNFLQKHSSIKAFKSIKF